MSKMGEVESEEEIRKEMEELGVSNDATGSPDVLMSGPMIQVTVIVLVVLLVAAGCRDDAGRGQRGGGEATVGSVRVRRTLKGGIGVEVVWALTWRDTATSSFYGSRCQGTNSRITRHRGVRCSVGARALRTDVGPAIGARSPPAVPGILGGWLGPRRGPARGDEDRVRGRVSRTLRHAGDHRAHGGGDPADRGRAAVRADEAALGDVDPALRIEEKGKVVLEKELPYAAATFASGMAVAGARIVIFGARPAQQDEGMLVGLDAKTGAELYAVKLAGQVTHGVEAMAYNGRYVVLQFWTYLRAYDPATGEQVW